MKRFVRNDNMTKRQSTFLCIMTSYRKVTRILQSDYKRLQTCNLTIFTGSPEGVDIIYTSLAGICMYKGAAKGAAKGATFRSYVQELHLILI